MGHLTGNQVLKIGQNFGQNPRRVLTIFCRKRATKNAGARPLGFSDRKGSAKEEITRENGWQQAVDCAVVSERMYCARILRKFRENTVAPYTTLPYGSRL